jgi:retron-type reverse transcriptase
MTRRASDGYFGCRSARRNAERSDGQFSYGFRPSRSPHQALDALSVGIMTKKVNWVLDADIRDFFGSVTQEWLVKFVEHRIGDQRLVLIQKCWPLAC